MNHWFTRADAPITKTWVKRFDPMHWTVDAPHGCFASIITLPGGHGFSVTAEFLRQDDLVGLIFESVDRHAHPAHARATSRDYSGTTLSFRWEATGAMALDAANGATLTIEGRDELGAPRAWYVRLWNYAQGSRHDAVVTIDFDKLAGGFGLPADADPVDPRDIDRIFISIVPPDYAGAAKALRPAPARVNVTISGIRCDGRSSVLAINDAVVPDHQLRIATAYDDLYHLPPERVIDAIERLGYRKIINHYIGMSHYFALGADSLLDETRRLNSAALAWHADFARAAAEREFQVIWSVSYEVFDAFCSDAWKQRSADGRPALTGWEPPSALISPANHEAMAFLQQVAVELAQLAAAAGLEPIIQIGEPWWWVMPDGALCLYDDAAKTSFGGAPPVIDNVRTAMTSVQTALLDSAGAILAQSTQAIATAVRAATPGAQVMLLAYLPTVLDASAPELRRANLPIGWARPSFDVLQLEDYEWVTSGASGKRREALALVEERLGYAPDQQHYLAGFVLAASQRAEWREVIAAASEAQDRGTKDVFIWALPQVLRDGVTLFGEQSVTEFDDVEFPIAIGAEASVAPTFSTNVVTSASGHEFRNVNWQQARLCFDAGPGVRGDHELETLLAFFRARRGAAVAFRFRDPFDFSSSGMTGVPEATDQAIGTGDGVATRFRLTKSYGTGEQRRISRPVAGSIRVAVNGQELPGGWTLTTRGEITFATAPPAGAAVSAGFLFDVPVRFADDRLEINRATFLAGEAPSVPLIEIRED